MEWVKKNISVFVFFFFMVFLLFILLNESVTLDPLTEYGMSHAIRMGEIPYKDINTVSTPLFIMIFSLGLFIYDSFSIFLLEACLLYTGIYYCLKELLGKNVLWVLLSMSIFLFFFFIPTYNTMAFFFMVLLMLLERKGKTSDFVMGILFGCMILSKHTIGLPIFLCTCIGLKDWKRIGKRVEGCFIPGCLFVIFLLVTGSFVSFFDLCFFGLFDFGGNNRLMIPWCVILSLILFGLTCYFTKKNSKNILWYYALGAIFFVIPICDTNHFPMYFPVFFISFLEQYSDRIKGHVIPSIFIGLFVLFNVLLRWENLSHLTFSPFHHFEGTLMYEPAIPIYQGVVDAMKREENVIPLDPSSMFIDIIRDRKIDYFSVPLRGNYGYAGTKGMTEKVNLMKNTYFIINEDFYQEVVSGKRPYSQHDTELMKYVMDHSEKAAKVSIYTIFYKP